LSESQFHLQVIVYYFFWVINRGYSVFQHELTLKSSDFTKSVAESAKKEQQRFFCVLIFCLDELGVWLTLKVLAFLLNF